MKTSQLIAVLQKSLKQDGDLPVFLNTGNDDDMWEPYTAIAHQTEDGEFPKSWNMPEAFLKLCA